MFLNHRHFSRSSPARRLSSSDLYGPHIKATSQPVLHHRDTSTRFLFRFFAICCHISYSDIVINHTTCQYRNWAAGWIIWGSNPVTDNRVFSSPNHPDPFLGPKTPYLMVTGVFWVGGWGGGGKAARAWNWLIHLHLVQRLKMGGVITLLLLYAFMTYTWRLLFF
jgi:hypothetical protein